jgi:hypothetical protein
MGEVFSYNHNMLIGFSLALFLFAPLAYFVTRGVVSHSYQGERPLLGVVFLFLALLGGLSLLSVALLAAGSMMGFSGAVALEALAHLFPHTQPGIITAIGGIVIAVWGFIGLFTGPACAFIAAKITALIALVTALVKVDESNATTWMPVAAAGVALFALWPFTAYLTLGL